MEANRYRDKSWNTWSWNASLVRDTNRRPEVKSGGYTISHIIWFGKYLGSVV